MKQRGAALAHRCAFEHALVADDGEEIGLEIRLENGLRHSGAKVAPLAGSR